MQQEKPKIVRITTVSSSLLVLLKGQLNYMANFYEVIGISANKQGLDKVMSQEGIDTFEIAFTRKITPIKDLIALIKLTQLLRKLKPDIVHTHTPKAGTLGLTAAFFAKIPHRLHTIAGLPLMEAKGAKRWLLNTVEKITYAFATKIYPNSKGLYDFVVEQKFTKPHKLKVIGHGSSNGIDTTHFDPKVITINQKEALKESLGISNKDRVIVYVGRLVGDKGIHELIEAFCRSNEHEPNLKLILVGDYERHLDPLRPEVEEILTNHPNILAVGYQTDVRPYFAISEALVFPSYREGFPNVVMQAGAMGLPVIATNINGCNEIIIPNKNGILVPTKDSLSLEKAITSILQNNNFDGSLCRKMIEERYAQKKIWEEIRHEYQTILGK